MKYPITILTLILTGLGCNETPSPVDEETSLHDHISQNLELLTQLNDHYRAAQNTLTERMTHQRKKLATFLRNEPSLLQTEKPVIGLFLSHQENSELLSLTRQLCRTKQTLESLESYLAKLSSAIEHAELWLQINSPIVGSHHQPTSLDTEYLLLSLEALTQNVPRVSDVESSQIAHIVNESLDELRERVAQEEMEDAEQKRRMAEVRRAQQEAMQEQFRQRELENRAWINLQMARVCDWPSIELEVKCKMIALTLGYLPSSYEQAEILRYMQGCVETIHPKTKYGSAKLHIEYAIQVLRNRTFGDFPKP